MMASAMLRPTVQTVKTVEVTNSSEPSCVNVISVSSGVENSKFFVSLTQLTNNSDFHIVKIPVECVPDLIRHIASTSLSVYTKSLQDAVIPDITKLVPHNYPKHR